MPAHSPVGQNGRVSERRPDLSVAYRAVVSIGAPIMTWSRLRVTGLEHLPRTGPVLLVADHDSYWDPIAIAVAARKVRPIRALAKSTIWHNKIVGAFMTNMGHIPVTRGASNAEALATAADELRNGACIGIFPEGTRSLGRELRARNGVGRLAHAVPEAAIVCARVNGTVDVVRLPHRPTVTVDFYLPAGGGRQPAESVDDFAERLLAELREGAPREVPGRGKTAAKYRADVTD